MTFWGWCFRGCSWGICWCWGLFCSDRKHSNNQFLSLSTIILVSTNEKERTGLIKLKHRGTRIHSLERLLCVAAVVIIFCHPQHRVRPFIVLEDKRVIDLEPVSLGPVIVTLRGVYNPAIVATYVEAIVGHRKREEVASKQSPQEAETSSRLHFERNY